MRYAMAALAMVGLLAVGAEAARPKKRPAPPASQPASQPAQAQSQPAQAEAQPAGPARPLEEVLGTEKAPNGKHVMVMTHILVEGFKNKAMEVKFIDAKKTPSVHIKFWDAKARTIKPGSTVEVTGELHYGAVSGGTPSIRYKVKEISGRVYNDHRHWRTDQAIYIINPTFTIVPKAAETQPAGAAK